jgi:hypothetical protein
MLNSVYPMLPAIVADSKRDADDGAVMRSFLLQLLRLDMPSVHNHLRAVVSSISGVDAAAADGPFPTPRDPYCRQAMYGGEWRQHCTTS